MMKYLKTFEIQTYYDVNPNFVKLPEVGDYIKMTWDSGDEYIIQVTAIPEDITKDRGKMKAQFILQKKVYDTDWKPYSDDMNVSGEYVTAWFPIQKQNILSEKEKEMVEIHLSSSMFGI